MNAPTKMAMDIAFCIHTGYPALASNRYPAIANEALLTTATKKW
jgi:hypothetical protein